jgi:hypothetical protein
MKHTYRGWNEIMKNTRTINVGVIFICVGRNMDIAIDARIKCLKIL